MSKIMSADQWSHYLTELWGDAAAARSWARARLRDHDRALRSRLAEAEELLRFVWEDVRDVDPVGLPREWRDTYARVRAFLGETP